MTYKAVADRVPRTRDTFRMGRTRTIAQRNGVVSTVTEAQRGEGLERRSVHIFANGARAERIAPHIREGMISTLEGKYSQNNVFVALGVVEG